MQEEVEIDLRLTHSDTHSLKNSNILVVNGQEHNFNNFFNDCLKPNQPCIVKNIDLNWPCFKSWVTSDNKPDLESLSNSYNSVINAAQCHKKSYDVHEKIEMNLAEYLKYWRNFQLGLDTRCLYLKDWHFMRDFPNNDVYRVPMFFASDWLGEYYDNHPEINDDYRFVYIGPKGSWTPLHMDVFSSYSWSVNIVGRKRWLLLEPGIEDKFKDARGILPFEKNLKVPSDTTGVYDFQQESGEAIFVPSGWHHQVWNMEDTISINHNWVNGSNILWMWNALKDNLKLVKLEIKDCEEMDDWDGHCQIMLKALFGINCSEFYRFLAETINHRIESVISRNPLSVFGGWRLGLNYLHYDLNAARKVLAEVKDDSHFQGIAADIETPNSLYFRLNNVLKMLDSR